ncbi:MAG: hypothetical protein AAFZ17_10290 [Cyanobacteria bacterium J06650_10]
MASSSVSASLGRKRSSLKPLAIYWLIGAIVGALYLRSELTSLSSGFDAAHLLSIAAALLATVVTTVAYSRVVMTGGRSHHFPTLFGFSLANGLCETILFIASFKVGVAIAARFTTTSTWLFLAGTLTFFAYSGAIHAFFWLKILPPHLNKSPAVKNLRIVWIIGLTLMSLLWGWLYFGYQDVWSVVVLHVLFDAGMVYSIRYRLG